MIQRITFTGEVDEEGLPIELGRIFTSGLPHALFSDGTIVPIVRGGATDDDDDDGDDDTDDTDDDDGDDDDDDDTGKPDDIKDPERKRLADEAARYRVRAKAERQKRLELEKRIADLEDQNSNDDKEDLAKVAKERDELKGTNANLSNDLNQLRIELAVREAVSDLNLDPKRMKAIIKVMDVDDIDVDDGEVSGVRESLESVAKEYPEWVIKASGKDDDDEDESKSTGGGNSGKPLNSKKGKSGVDRDALAKRFPALQGR